MAELRILVVEDNPVSSLHLEMLLGELKYSNVSMVRSAEEALIMIKDSRPDLILLDIELKGPMDGIAFAQKVNGSGIPIIFTTAFSNSQVYDKAKLTNPFAYLTKPITKIALESTIDSVVRNLDLTVAHPEEGSRLAMEEEIFIKAANRLVKIKVADILAIEAEGNYCTIFSTDKKLVVKLSLAKVMERLDASEFYQMHRNYVIQLAKIDSILLSSNEVILGEYTLPIGRKFRAGFIARLKKI